MYFCVLQVFFARTSRLLSGEKLATPPELSAAIRVRLGLYVGSFVLLQAFGVINRAQNAMHPTKPVFALYVAHSVATPLQVRLSQNRSVVYRPIGVSLRLCCSN